MAHMIGRITTKGMITLYGQLHVADHAHHRKPRRRLHNAPADGKRGTNPPSNGILGAPEMAHRSLIDASENGRY
jgi:hypothetical protein